jgi:hypothetical protein
LKTHYRQSRTVRTRLGPVSPQPSDAITLSVLLPMKNAPESFRGVLPLGRLIGYCSVPDKESKSE